MKNKLKRVLALTFCAIFMVQGLLPTAAPMTAYAADNPDLANWSVHLDFVDPEDDQNLTDDYTLNVDANSYGSDQIKLQITIKYTGDGSVTYAPGDVHFTLNDLRDIIGYSPGQYYSYDIAAELVGSNSGRGDWYYTEDYVSSSTVKENTFNFTNKNEISSATTSTFQIVMRPYLRYAPAEYAKTLETELSFDNISGTVPSNKAKFTYHGTKSTFSLTADSAKVDDGVRDPILGKIPDDKTTDDYIFTEMKFKAPYITEKIAHIYKTKLEADFPDDVIISDICKVDSANSGVFSNATPSIDENNYTVISSTLSENCPLSAKDAYSFTILIAFPRDKYLEMGSYTQHFTLNGQFYNENYTQIAETDLVFNFSELNYIWKPGSLYNMEKSAYGFNKTSLSETYYDRNYVYENMTYSYDNTDYLQSKRFDISVTAVYTGEPYDLVIGDDLQYLVYPDNTYRKLDDDERIITRIALPTKLAGIDTEVYGRKPGTDDYELFKKWTPTTSNTSLAFDLTERYCDVKIKLLNVTKTLDDCRIYVYLGTMINKSNEAEQVPAKVYNLSYMDILINDTLQSIERIAVNTNITGLADDIDAYDNETYGRLLYRSADYKTILPGKAGVHQSQGSSSYYNEDTEVTDKYVYITYGTVPVFYDYQAGGNTWCDFQDKYTLPAGWDTDLDDMAFYFSLNSGDYTDIRLADGQSFRLSKIIQHEDLPEALKSQISINKETNADGNIVLTVHYDFTENPIVNKGETFEFFKPFFKIRIDLDTFQMLDLNGKSVKLVHDRTINQDSNTTVFTNTSRRVNDTLKCPSIAYSTYQGVSIESSVNGGDFDKTDKTISYGQNYEYKLRFATSSSKVKNLVFFDLLDGNYGSEEHWQGVFQGVNVSALAALGITPTIYYSTNASQSSDLSSSSWIKNTDFIGDLSNVKAVAVSLGDNVINPNSMIFVKIKMKAIEDTSISNKAAYNNTSVSYKSYDSSLTVLTDDNALENIKDLASNTTQIQLQGNQKIHINYMPNGGTGDTLTDTILAQDEYTIRQNSFEREGYTFIGWDPDKDRNDGNAKYQPGQNMSDALVGFDISTPTSDNYVDLYAIWDKAPEVRGETLTFYEGEQVTKEDLLEKATASDEEDGNLTAKIRIVKLVYSEGKIVDGVKTTEKETVSWASDMPDDYKLDTWFMQLDKEDSPVTHKITYEVTDSTGNTSQSVADIKVFYNEFPEIQGNTKHFVSLEDARAGRITKETFLDELIAAGTLRATDKEDDVWYPNTITSKITLLNFSEEFFTKLQGPAYTTLYYSVKDSLGKEAVFTAKVYIIKDGEIKDGDKIAKLRFIDQNNYMKNKDMVSEDLTEEQAATCAKNGGLPLNSLWYNDASYRDLIIPVLYGIESSDKTKAIERHSFTQEDILRIKQEASTE